MKFLLQDLRYATYGLTKDLGFTLAVVVTLACALGAGIAVFSVINALFLRPLPFESPERLVHVWGTDLAQGWDRLYTAPPDFADWKRAGEEKTFERLGAFISREYNLAGEAEPDRVQAARLSSDVLPLLGVEPMLGRAFSSSEDRVGGERVVLLGYGLWKERFAGNPRAVGRKILLNNEIYTVIGVMPPKFAFPMPRTRLWVPLALEPKEEDRASTLLQVVGRLAPGVSREQARAALGTVAARLSREHPATNAGRGVDIVPLRQALTFSYETIRRISTVLVLAVAFVLLIACANVTNLLLVRAQARSRDVAIRTALGANRWQIARHILAESTVLALLSGIVGLLFARWSERLLLRVVPEEAYRVGQLGVDAEAMLFGFLAALVVALLTGLAAGFLVGRGRLTDLLREGTPAAGVSPRSRRLHGALVVAETGLAIILLTAALLMYRTLHNLQQVNPGFDRLQVLTAKLTIPKALYTEDRDISAFFAALVERIGHLPEVEAASIVNFLPLNHETRWREIYLEGGKTLRGQEPSAIELVAGPDYFQVLGIPLLRGRALTAEDDLDAHPVAVVNRVLAERFWPGRDPLGRRLAFSEDGTWYTVVGVVADTKHTGLDAPGEPMIYVSILQTPWRYARLIVRTRGEPLAHAAAVQKALWSLDSTLPLSEIRSLDAVTEESLRNIRFVTGLLIALSVGAFLLAGLGIYTVMAYVVSRSNQEIGVRMALGAPRALVVRMFLQRGLRLALLGLVVGLAGATALHKILSSLLYGVHPGDPLALAGTALVLALVAVIASSVPAFRASQVEPATVLRQ